MAIKQASQGACAGRKHVGLKITCKKCKGKGKEKILPVGYWELCEITCQTCGGYGWFCTTCKKPRRK